MSIHVLVSFNSSPSGQMQSAPSGVLLHLYAHWLFEHDSKSQPGPSSAPLGQSSFPSHIFPTGMHLSVIFGHCQCPLGHLNGDGPHACLWSSSEPSPQSSEPSQIHDLKMHFELLHLKWLLGHSISPHVEGSSLPSSQSGFPSLK